MLGDIHDCKGRIRNARKTLREDFCEYNGNLASDFFDALLMFNLSYGRISIYAECLRRIYCIRDKPVIGWTQADIKYIHMSIAENNWSNSTKRDTLTALKRVYHFAKHDRIVDSHHGEEYDPLLVSIKPGRFKDRYEKIQANDLITNKEFLILLRTAKEKGGMWVRQTLAVLYLLREGAYRPGELLAITVGSLDFYENFLRICTTGKTGPKKIALVTSMNPIREWMEDHPNPDDPKAYLFYPGYPDVRRYKTLNYTIKVICKKANINKKIWLTLFRHIALTDYSKKMGNVTRAYGNWKVGSDMLSYYEHMSDTDQENAILKMHGLLKTDDHLSLFMQDCPQCGKRNNIDKRYCTKCGAAMPEEPEVKEEKPDIDGLIKKMKTLEAMYLEQKKALTDIKQDKSDPDESLSEDKEQSDA